MKVDKAREIWEEIVRENFHVQMEFQVRWLARLLKVKVGRHGVMRATYKRSGKLRNDRNYEWVFKHFPSLLKKYEERMEHEQKKESKDYGPAG